MRGGSRATPDQRLQLRRLRRDEVELIWTIDRSEVHHHIYELRAGQLVRTAKCFEIPGMLLAAEPDDIHLLFPL